MEGISTKEQLMDGMEICKMNVFEDFSFLHTKRVEEVDSTLHFSKENLFLKRLIVCCNLVSSIQVVYQRTNNPIGKLPFPTSF